MSATEVTAYAVGAGGLLTGLAAYIQAKSDVRKKKVEGTTIGETALANAVKVVEEVYDKVTGRMNVQIDELLEDNQRLRHDVGGLREEVKALIISEQACRVEVAALRNEIKTTMTNVQLSRDEVQKSRDEVQKSRDEVQLSRDEVKNLKNEKS